MQGGGRDRLVVVGNGMVGHRFLEFLGERVAATGRAPFDVTVHRRGAAARLRSRRPVGVLRRQDAGGPRAGASRAVRGRRLRGPPLDARAPHRSRAPGRRGRRRRGPVRPPGARDRLVGVRAARSRARSARLLRLPHHRGPGGDLRLGGRPPGRHRRRDRRRPARARGGVRAAEAGDEDARRRAGAAADGVAARRRGRRRSAQAHRGDGRRRPHGDGQPRGRAAPTGASARCGSRTAASWTSTRSSSRRASARATSWRAPRSCRSASAAAS